MSIRILDGLGAFRQLSSAWNSLEPRAVVPMQHLIWARACASAFARDGELAVLAAEDGGRTTAIASLLRRGGRPFLEWLGVDELHEPADALYADADASFPLAKALVDLKMPLSLRRIPADSPLVEALQEAFRGRGALIRSRDTGWPWIALDARGAEPESGLNAGRRSDLRRAWRIADEMGPVCYEERSPTPQTLEPSLEEALAVEAAGWKGEAGTAMALDPARGAFYRRYAAEASEKGILRLQFLRIGLQAAAMQMAVESGGRLWLLKIGYDRRFARCSPGSLLLRETLRRAAERGLKSIEFLGNVEPWTRIWTRLERPCVTLRGYPLGLHGMSALARDAARCAYGRLSRSLCISP